MGRLVEPQRSLTLESGPGARAEAAYSRDEFEARVAKYIPAEVVGGYVSLDGILNPEAVMPPAKAGAAEMAAAAGAAVAAPLAKAAPVAAKLALFGPTLVFLFCLILAPLYVWHLGRKSNNPTWKVQAVIAVFAFTIWAYATKGSVFFNNEVLYSVLGGQAYNPQLAAALLVIFSLGIAFYEPKGN